MIRAWHFVGSKLRDGSPIPPDGEWLEFPGECVMCVSGLHASRDPFDALQDAPGETLCLVECDEVVAEQPHKLVCHRRRIVGRIDVTELLRWFARMQALSVIHLWTENPPEVVLDWLMTGDEAALAAALAAASEVAWAASAAAWAARAVASEAAWAASAAASAAASEAAWAARAAASAAAWAARAAASAAAREEFNSLIYAEFAEFL